MVILMQENRSFDHYFGRLKGVRGFGDRSGITLSGGQPVFNQPNGLGRQYPWKLSSTPAAGGVDGETLAQCNGDLPHSWSSQHSAWNKGRLDHWVAGVGNVRSLGYLDRGDIPFHYALADNYTVCDAYFSSTLSATGPNRTYLWSGKVDGSSYDGGDESGLTWETYAEALQRAGVSWKVYQNANDNYGDNGLAYFSKIAGAEPGDPLHDRGMASVPAVTGSTPDDIAAAIKADALAGTLPRSPGLSPTRRSPSTPTPRPATEPTSWTSSTAPWPHPPRCSTRPSSSSTTTRTTASSTTYPRRHLPPVRPASSSTEPPSASASVSRWWSCPPGPEAAGSPRRSSTTRPSCDSWRPGRPPSAPRRPAPTSARGAARSPAT